MKTCLYLGTTVAGMMIGGNVWAQCEAGYERTEGICAKPCEPKKGQTLLGMANINCGAYEGSPINGRCMCEKYQGYVLKSKEFVNGEWKCEYNSYKTEVRSNCLPLY